MNYQYVLGGDHVFVLFVVVKFTKESSLLMKNKHMILVYSLQAALKRDKLLPYQEIWVLERRYLSKA